MHLTVADLSGSAVSSVEAVAVDSPSSQLGESLVWDAQAHTLCWVDIATGDLLCRTASGEVSTLLHDRPGISLVRRVTKSSGGGLVVAMHSGVSVFDTTSEALIEIAEYGRPASMHPRLRFNDGECDSAGRLWLGSLDDDGLEPGRLYCMNCRGVFTEHLSGLDCPNGIGWNTAETTVYLVESVSRRILSADFNASTATMSNWRVAVQFDPSGPLPDGLTMTEGGGMWVAFWGGSCAVHLDPAGVVTARVDLPTPLVTSVAATGPGLTEMHVTTARSHDTCGQVDPCAGQLYRFTSPVAGVEAHGFTAAY